MRILFTFTGGTGHFHPLVPVAQAARARGHLVAFAGARELAAQVEGAGFLALGGYRRTTPEGAALRAEILALPTVAEREALTVRKGFAGLAARARAADVLRVCAAWRPALLVRDELDFGACVAAERRGLPHAVVLVLAAGSLLRPELIARPLHDLRAAHGLPPDPDLAMLHRYLVLAPFPPRFRDPRFPLPETAHAVRPLLFDQSGDEGLPTWISGLPNRPTVLFSLGTAWNAREQRVFAPVVAGLRDLPISLVVTVGRDLDPAFLGPQPPNVRVERYIPLSLLLPHCDLFVQHGGSGTVMAALAQGIPLVLLPLGADQPQNAERCAALGVARVIDPDELSATKVRDAVVAVLGDPTYRANAQQVRAEIATLPGPDEVVPLLERLAATAEPQIAPT
jgi:UDP:flavonoid glycosyltransferase YjiC (YdhE family)